MIKNILLIVLLFILSFVLFDKYIVYLYEDQTIRQEMSLDKLTEVIKKSRTYKQVSPFPDIVNFVGSHDFSQYIPKYIDEDKNVKYFAIRLENVNNKNRCEIVIACNIGGNIENNKVVLIFLYKKDFLDIKSKDKYFSCFDEFSLSKENVFKEASVKW